MKWGTVIPGVVERTVPGSTHYSIWTGERLAGLAEVVRQVLEDGSGSGVDGVGHRL
jgi:hypothetical protein